MSLLDQIRRYRPEGADDVETRERFLAFVGRHHDCCDRTLSIGHITASAWVVDPEGARVVLVHHRKLARWLQPGGHADGNPDTEAAARREVAEETGLLNLALIGSGIFDLDIHPIPAFRDIPEHLHYDVRHAFRLVDQAPLILSGESHEVAWAPIGDLERFQPDPSLLRMREKWRALCGS